MICKGLKDTESDLARLNPSCFHPYSHPPPTSGAVAGQLCRPPVTGFLKTTGAKHEFGSRRGKIYAGNV